MHGKCDRARQWTSLEQDGELSSFERALLESHVAGCASCAEFRGEISGLTNALRAAPYEPFEGVVLGRVRRRVRLRLAPAAPAVALGPRRLRRLLGPSPLPGSSLGRF